MPTLSSLIGACADFFISFMIAFRQHDHWPLATTMVSDLQPPCEPLIHHMVVALHPFSSVCMTANQDQIWVGPLRFASSTCINVKLQLVGSGRRAGLGRLQQFIEQCALFTPELQLPPSVSLCAMTVAIHFRLQIHRAVYASSHLSDAKTVHQSQGPLQTLKTGPRGARTSSPQSPH